MACLMKMELGQWQAAGNAPAPDRTGIPLAIEARGLVKSFDGFTAVDGVDLSVPEGVIYGVLGPNGAGKTTTVEILEGYRRASGGRVRVLATPVMINLMEAAALDGAGDRALCVGGDVRWLYDMRSKGTADAAARDGKEASLEDLASRIAMTITYVKGIDPKKMEGMEDRDITFPVGDEKMTLKGADYLFNFSMPNFYFHYTMAYAILRHNGLDLGKRDYLGA